MHQLGYDVPATALAERLRRRGERREIFVAVLAGRVVGWTAVSTDEPFVEGFGAELEGLVVDEAARSAGVGRALLEAAQEWARERGCTEMRVKSNVVRERAHEFYHRHGYDAIKRQYHFRKPLKSRAASGSIAIRRVSDESEFQRLYELFVEYEADLPLHLRHGTVPEVVELRESYAAQNAAFLATLEGDAVGCVAVRQFDAHTALLLRLFVRPSGRGLGAARSLVNATIEHARSGGYRRIVLDTNKQQLMPAYRLYRSLGFDECEPFATVTYECPTFMELLLRP
jgi:GNAT superfamily N-acetyltransferase